YYLFKRTSYNFTVCLGCFASDFSSLCNLSVFGTPHLSPGNDSDSDGPQTLLKLRLLNAWGSYGLKNPTLIFNYCTLWNDEELGSVYFVSNFRVKPPAPSYRSCSHKLTIILSAAT
ncbi:unnamed protein product, partial [Linum tenue]